MDDLLSMPHAPEPSISDPSALQTEPVGKFDIPNEIKATMSKDEIYALQGIPGYFTPKQTSTQQLSGQGMLLLDTQVIDAIVVVDEEYRAIIANLYHTTPEFISWDTVYDFAWNILEGGGDALEANFGIDIQMTIATNWETPDDKNLEQLLYMIDDVDPTGVGCDILCLMTGQEDSVNDGIAWTPEGTGGGRHSVMKPYVAMSLNLFQHEVTHNLGPSDHGWDFGIFCIMSYAY